MHPRSSDYSSQDSVELVGWVGTYVVSFCLEPIEWVLGAVSAITGCRVRNTVVRVGTTSARELSLGHGNGRGSSSDVALEPGHIVYRRSR